MPEDVLVEVGVGEFEKASSSPRLDPKRCTRVAAAKLADRDIMARTGKLLTVGELAREYDFTDVDGTQPEPFGLPQLG
jgi:hypothetical protein